MSEDMQIQLALHQSLLDVDAALPQHLHDQDRLQQTPGEMKLGAHGSSNAARLPMCLPVNADFRLAAFRHGTQSELATADDGSTSGLYAAVPTAFTAVDRVPVMSEFYLDAIVAQASRDRLTTESQALLNAFAFDKHHQQHGTGAFKMAEKLTKQEV